MENSENGNGYGYTRVTVEDGLGVAEVQEVKDNFLVICDGECYIDGIQHWSNGTTQLTIKKGEPPA